MFHVEQNHGVTGAVTPASVGITPSVTPANAGVQGVPGFRPVPE